MTAQAALLDHEPATRTLIEPQPASSADFSRMEERIAERVLPLAADFEAAPVRLRVGRREIVAIPLDTRRFVQAMAKHMCFN